MNRKMGRSRCIGLALTGCACVGIVLAGVWLGGGGEGTVYDRNGKEIGALYLDGGVLQYRCEEGYEAYVDLVRSETLDLVMEQEEADEADLDMPDILSSLIEKLQLIEDKYYYSIDIQEYLNDIEEEAYAE